MKNFSRNIEFQTAGNAVKPTVSQPELILAVNLDQAGVQFSHDQPIEGAPAGWRVDFAVETGRPFTPRAAIEVEGGVFSAGRHTRGVGFTEDCEKYNWLTEHGWIVLRYTPAMIDSGAALAQILRVLGKEAN